MGHNSRLHILRQPGTTFGSAIFDYVPTFIPDPGVKSKLIAGGSSLQKTDDGEYLDLSSNHGYNPADPVFGGSYQLTLRNGDEYAINAATGDLASITSLNGNQLDFTGSGISASNANTPHAPR